MSNPISLYLDPQNRVLDPRSRDLEPEPRSVGFITGLVRAVDVEKRTVTGLVSTGNVDRYDEIVDPAAFAEAIEPFMQNPVFVAQHNYGSSDGSPTVIGKWLKLWITKEGVMGTAEFARTPLAEQYWELYRDGYQKGFSIGFIALKWEMRDFRDSDGSTKRMRVFTRLELLEISAVAIPANRQSLARVASALSAVRPHGDGQELSPEADAGDEEQATKALGTMSRSALQRTLSRAMRPVIQAAISAELERIVNDLDGPVARLIRDTVHALKGQPDYFDPRWDAAAAHEHDSVDLDDDLDDEPPRGRSARASSGREEEPDLDEADDVEEELRELLVKSTAR